MKLKFSDNESENENFNFDANNSIFDFDENQCQFASSLNVKGTIKEKINYYSITGTIKIGRTMECSRCLTSFSNNSQLSFKFLGVISIPTYEDMSGMNTELAVAGDEDLILIDKKHDLVDITDKIRENIILNIPMKPLCSEECKGLCVNCGKNLNNVNCKCENKNVDERWSVLKDKFT